MRSLWAALGGLALVLLVGEATPLDVWVQDRVFDFSTHSWWIGKDDPWPRLFFYSGAKIFFAVLGCGLLVVWWFSRRKPYRTGLELLLLAMVLVPLLLSGAKNVTNVHCPWSLERYGGRVPHVTVFSSYPIDFQSERPGKCFPAGHPAGGFAFMMLFFVLRSRKARIAGLLFGVTMGWILGVYQILKGAHFFSHVMVSMLAAWILIVLIHEAVIRFHGSRG